MCEDLIARVLANRERIAGLSRRVERWANALLETLEDEHFVSLAHHTPEWS